MSEQEIRAQVREFVGRFVRGHELDDGEDIFATGFVNSMFAMQLVQFVETTFGITCESEDLEIDNFRSIDALTAFVQRKQGVAA
ncbi:MAG TPA: phosphopantetheine-binding protein [Longimicrobiaceae bacterium]|nr:phosphopantetheine-binding protein [Longimicrobiaceae bacterium]